MSRSRKYITDTILVLTKDVVVRGSGFIINVLLTKFLNPFGFGVYSLFQTSGNGINSVLKLGGFETSTQLMVANPKNHENIFKLSSIICTPFIVRISIAIIGFLILALFPDWIANDLLGQPDILNYVLVLAVFVFFLILEIQTEFLLKGLQQFNFLSIIQISFTLISIISISISTYFFSLDGAIISLTLTGSLRSIFMMLGTIYILQSLKVTLVFHDFWRTLISHIKVGTPHSIEAAIFGPVNLYLIYLLTSNFGVDELAYQRIIYSIGSIIMVIPFAIQTTFLSEGVVKSNDGSNLEAFFLRNLKFVFFVSLLVVIIISGVLPLLIKLAFGSDYSAAVDLSLTYLNLFILINVFNLTTSFFLTNNKISLDFYSHILHVFLFLIFGSILIENMGLRGYLIASVLGYAISFLTAIFFLSYILKFRLTIQYIIYRFSFIYLFFYLILKFILSIDPVIPRFLVSCSGSITLATLAYMFILDEIEKAKVKSYIKKLFNFNRG